MSVQPPAPAPPPAPVEDDCVVVDGGVDGGGVPLEACLGSTIEPPPVHELFGFDGMVSALLRVAPQVPQAFGQVTETFKIV